MSMPVQKPYASKQDYGTPKEFLNAVEAKFGRITFDLAAHRANKVCDNYFAPKQLTLNYKPKDDCNRLDELIDQLIRAGAHKEEAVGAVVQAFTAGDKTKIVVENHDMEPKGFDSLTQDWTKLPSGVWWLNPEYEDIAPWAEKCYKTVRDKRFDNSGRTVIAFLIPASVGTNYFADFIHEKSYVNFLSPRMSFDSKNPYPKDLLLAIYGSGDEGYTCWRWKD